MHMNRYLIIYACLASFLIACSGESSSGPTSGSALFQNVSYTKGAMTDSRDGLVYNVVTIGSQTWMAQNLNYETADSYCYNDDVNNCSRYGRLYTWFAAKTACPSGWHLPSKIEWEILLAAVGGASTAEPALKSTSGWSNNFNITNASGFSALPSGARSYGSYTSEGYDAIFWSSTALNDTEAFDLYLCDDHGDAAEILYHDKNKGYSVRCLMN